MIRTRPLCPPDCPLCTAVMSLRAREAALWQQEHEERKRRRCPCCAFLRGHAPDCPAAAGPATARLLAFLETVEARAAT